MVAELTVFRGGPCRIDGSLKGIQELVLRFGVEVFEGKIVYFYELWDASKLSHRLSGRCLENWLGPRVLVQCYSELLCPPCSSYQSSSFVKPDLL